ncbi:MAG: PQQ-binding-like beta-propeller repeat protein [Bacteroidetes bacterium]|nr:PQQ-binding-like beta-propeller repeat protein [Bacteroidota bacterium]
MFRNLLYKYFLPGFVILGTGILVWWIFYNPTSSFIESVPGMDNRKAGKSISKEQVKIGENFVFSKTCADIPGTRWTRFRGQDFDNICKEKVPLIDQFGATGPKILWNIPVGDGHASPAVYDGRIYLLDYDEASKSDALRCLSLLTGEELWRRSYKVHLKRNHGLSRTIPAVSAKYVISLGPRGQVMCVERLTGNLVWGCDAEKEYEAEIPFWYTGQCPIIENDTAIFATGGNSLVVAIDCKTGKKAWDTPNPHHWKMSHSSIMPMTFGGKKMYVYCAIGGTCGISAEGPDKGKILWENAEFSPAVIAPSPIVMDKGLILVMAGYGAGSAVIKVTKEGSSFSARIISKYKPSEGMASEQQTAINLNGYLYGIQPKDAGALRDQFVCYKPDNCQSAVMSSGKTVRFGLGPYIYADNKFFILNDNGEMTIAKASPGSFKVLDKARIIDGQDSWGPLTITGGYLLMRDSKHLVCIDIHKK